MNYNLESYSAFWDTMIEDFARGGIYMEGLIHPPALLYGGEYTLRILRLARPS